MDASRRELKAQAAAPVQPPMDADAERRIWESENRFRIMADAAPVLLWMAGKDSLCEFFNQGWLDFTGRSMADELGSGWAEGVHPEDFQRCMQTYLDAFIERKRFAMEYRLRRHDGEYRWVYDQGVPRFDELGAFVGFIGSCVDVTLQHQARDALAELNRELEERVQQGATRVSEREMLLREVHHRVKNDLQLVSSLLSLQGREFGDTAPARAFEECQARVQAIAHVHEHMYRSSRLTEMSFSEHLRAFCSTVIPAGEPMQRIRLELHAPDSVVIRVDRAIPCAMIVHELVVNAVKHAFPNERQGTIYVKCRRDDDGLVNVLVEDDGVGLPELFDERRTRTLGWTLINAFARQIDARLELAGANGTRVAVRFRDTPLRERRASGVTHMTEARWPG